MSEFDPIWQLVVVALLAFVLGRWSARAGRARQDDVVRPPPYVHPSATGAGTPSATSAPGMSGSNLALSPAALSDVHALIRTGHKIEAIKRVREETRMGLKEAKDFVESL